MDSKEYVIAKTSTIASVKELNRLANYYSSLCDFLDNAPHEEFVETVDTLLIELEHLVRLLGWNLIQVEKLESDHG